MKLRVITQFMGELRPVGHEGPWVEHDTEDGELRVTIRDEHDRMIGWEVYAQGSWASVCLVEGPSAEVLRERAAAAERDRNNPNGGRGYAPGPVGGNSSIN